MQKFLVTLGVLSVTLFADLTPQYPSDVNSLKAQTFGIANRDEVVLKKEIQHVKQKKSSVKEVVTPKANVKQKNFHKSVQQQKSSTSNLKIDMKFVMSIKDIIAYSKTHKFIKRSEYSLFTRKVTIMQDAKKLGASSVRSIIQKGHINVYFYK